jgi:hypothetical protein
MKTQHIVGKLTPKDEEVITPSIRRSIHEAVVATRLFNVISADRCELNNSVEINHTADAELGNHSPLEFFKQLNGFLWRVNSAGLQLDGEITVTVTGTDPVVYRAVVQDSKLGYKRAALSWNQELLSI